MEYKPILGADFYCRYDRKLSEHYFLVLYKGIIHHLSLEYYTEI